MLAGIARLKQEYVIVLVAIGLVLLATVAGLNVQPRSDDPFSGDVVRWIVFVVGIGTLGRLARTVSAKERPERKPHYFLLGWIIGQAIILGLVQTLPSPPTLETLQSLDIRSLDPFALAAVQWGAAWSAAVVLMLVFAGPPFSFGWGILIWLFGVVSTATVAATLPEDTLPPLVLLPIAAVWAACVYIGKVFSVSPLSVSDTGGRPVTRAVWASLALVMLALVLADFESFVALDQQVNANRTVTQRAMDGVATGINKVDQSLTSTAKAVRTQGDIKGALQALQSAITDVGDQVALVQETQQFSADLPNAEQAAAVVARVERADESLQGLLLPLGVINPDTDREQLTSLLGRDVPRAIATVRREANLAQQMLVANELPTAGVFLWVAAIYAALVLLPWILFVLFLLQKRESRARESLVDLCLLDGRPVPDRRSGAPFGEIKPGGLLDRVLGEGFQQAGSDGSGPTVGQVQSALVERAFSEPEYLIGLAMLSGIIAAGWYMVFYPKGGVGLADTIIQGADAAHLWAYLLSGLNPLTAAFTGAYFWCVYALVRRYLDSDLYPAAFLQCAVQFVLALVLSLIIAVGVPPVAQLGTSAASFLGDTASGLGSHLSGTDVRSAVNQVQANQSGGPVPPTTIEAITMLLAFFGGLSISAGFTQILSLLRILLKYIGLRTEQPLADQAHLTKLEGIDSWTEARLAEEGVDNIQALATAPLHRLVLRTHFTTQRIVDWVDQALLYMHTAGWRADPADTAQDATTPSDDDVDPKKRKSDLFGALRCAGIRTGTDLLGAGGWLKNASYVNLGEAVARQETLQRALGHDANDPALAAAVFTACQALIEAPNWVHVANYRHATRELLGQDTRQWIQTVSPPVPGPAENGTAANGVAEVPAEPAAHV